MKLRRSSRPRTGQCEVAGCHTAAVSGGLCTGHVDAVAASKRARRAEREKFELEQQPRQAGAAPALPPKPPHVAPDGNLCAFVDPRTGTRCRFPLAPGSDVACGLPLHQPAS